MQTTTMIPLLSASTLEGTNIRNRSGDDLGEVEDVMLDLDNGRIRYAVVSFGGFLGLGEKLFAIPAEAFTINTEDETLILDVDKRVLENAPGFDKDNWPDFSDPVLNREIHSHYSVTPYWTE